MALEKGFIYILSIWILSRLYIIHITAASKSQSAAIISGSKATLGQFPWHVILRVNETATMLKVCGGSIISNKWVLTAGHCVYNIYPPFMAFGTIKLNKTPINMTSKKIYIHPHFDPITADNDIALVELPTALTFNHDIKSIDLVSSKDASNNFLGAMCTITGHGQKKNTVYEYSEKLRWANVEIIANSVCAKAFDEPMADTVMCAKGYNGSKMSPCDGDSGGALVTKNKLNKFIQIGIISFSKQDNCSKYPSGYTRVGSYLDYIRSVTGLSFN